MEKRRRARINSCLGELKNLILNATKKDVSEKHFHLARQLRQRNRSFTV
jgi:hypothetical protein